MILNLSPFFKDNSSGNGLPGSVKYTFLYDEQVALYCFPSEVSMITPCSFTESTSNKVMLSRGMVSMASSFLHELPYYTPFHLTGSQIYSPPNKSTSWRGRRLHLRLSQIVRLA